MVLFRLSPVKLLSQYRGLPENVNNLKGKSVPGVLKWSRYAHIKTCSVEPVCRFTKRLNNSPFFPHAKEKSNNCQSLKNNLAPPVNYNIPIMQYYVKRVSFNVEVFSVVIMNFGSVDRRC